MSPHVLPVLHLRPDHGWINDPNGIVFHDGRWHVFYQHNPAAPSHAAIAWGHASSSDLMTWQDHGVAFGPTPGGPDAFGCWSGVAVTGLERPAVVYSGVVDASAQSTVVLRWGSSDLEAWGDPIVVGRMPEDAGLAIMRDPFVFTWGGRRWALVGAGAEDGTPRVLVYSCDDILAWRYCGTFLDDGLPVVRDGAPANIWECPQLVLGAGEGADLVIVSLWADGVLGDVVGITGHVVDGGGHPVFEAAACHPFDTGDCFYAPQAVVDPAGGPALVLGWAREGNLPAETHDVAGSLTFPRRVRIRDGRVEVALDDAVAARVAPEAATLAEGRHALATPVAVTLGRGTGRLTGRAPTGAETVVALTASDTAYLDAGVLEVVGDADVPATHRAEPGGTWVLELDPDAVAAVAALIVDGRSYLAR